MISHFNYRSLISPIRDFCLWATNFLSHSPLTILQKTNSSQSVDSSAEPDLQILNCRVKLTKQEKYNAVFDTFAVEICGSIHTTGDETQSDTILKISVVDITDVPQQLSLKEKILLASGWCTATRSQLAPDKTRPIYGRDKQWQMQDSPQFIYTNELGKLPEEVTILSDWTAVAQVHLEWLIFPRKGKRNLQFNTSILSRQTHEELACATCTFTYENPEFGYIDSQENIQRTKILTVALAFAVSASDRKLYNCELELIKNWAGDNIYATNATIRDKRKLDKALDKTIAFFKNGGKLNTHKICREIAQIAPVADRYDILELCLYVAQAKSFATAEELALLKEMAAWLEVDSERFREIFERILPVNIQKVKDVEAILGVTPDMSKEKTRQQLNKLFCKWNSRVTNLNPAIRDQADQMLKLIAEARSQYIG